MDDYSHYLFTPRDLTRWVKGLIRYDLCEETKNLQPLLEVNKRRNNLHYTWRTLIIRKLYGCFRLKVWLYEACRLFRDKLSEEEDVKKFDNIILSLLHSDWGVDLRKNITDSYYVSSAIGTVSFYYDEI